MLLTPEVCRAARGLLNWNLKDLADRAGVGFVTISEFERGRPAYASTLAKLAAAFEREGVELILEPRRTGAAAPRLEAAPLPDKDVEGPADGDKAWTPNPTPKS